MSRFRGLSIEKCSCGGFSYCRGLSQLPIHVHRVSRIHPPLEAALNDWCRGGLLRKMEISDLKVLKEREDWSK